VIRALLGIFILQPTTNKKLDLFIAITTLSTNSGNRYVFKRHYAHGTSNAVSI